jgi:predicted HTH domain antitoxin
MMVLKIEYPETLPDVLQKTKEQFEKDAKMAMAAKLYEMGQISSGIAAKLVGMDRVSFLLNLHHYGIAMIDHAEDELLSEIKNA